MSTEQCHYCAEPAEFLCDGITDKPPWSLKGTHKTCDRPLCRNHRVLMSSGHACFSDGCEPFTIDYCPQHALKEQLNVR